MSCTDKSTLVLKVSPVDLWSDSSIILSHQNNVCSDDADHKDINFDSDLVETNQYFYSFLLP